MWNTFDAAKERLLKQYKENHWIENSGLDLETLEREVSKILEQENKSVADAKSEAIAFILRNAQVDIHPDEFFAEKLNYGDIMDKFYWKGFVEVRGEDAKEANAKAYPFAHNAAVWITMDFGHLAPDWQLVMSCGIPGIIERLYTEQQKRPVDSEEYSFYQRSIIVYEAMRGCLLRMADCADALRTEKGHFIAGNLRTLAVSAPQTLAQAMQLTLFFYRIQTHLDTAIIRSLGFLDRLYAPYYENDIKNGMFTEPQLRELIRDFYWKIGAMNVTANVPFCICGKKDDGSDATNDFTFVLLEEYRLLNIYDPKIHVLYHKEINPKVIRLVLEMIREGNNSFVILNTEVAEKALQRIGISEEDSKKVIVYGCYETAAEGTEVAATCGGRVNMIKALELALYNGYDPYSDEIVGLQTGQKFGSFEDFLSAVKKQLHNMNEICMSTITANEHYYHKVCPTPIYSATFESSLVKGKDLCQGGAKYNNTSVVGLGLATMVDSLTVIKKLVFEEKKITLDELKPILLANWEGQEKLRLQCHNSYAKFGNNEAEADDIAIDIYESFCDGINGKENGRGGVFRAGVFSVDWRYFMSERVGATPDGRFKGEWVSKNLCASLGQDKKGVTSYLNSILKLDATKVPDSYVADVVLHCSAVKGEDGLLAFEGLLKNFIAKDGLAIHLNVLDPEMLRKAQKEPEKYQNLQIRLCGWNVRFVDLSTEEQNEFILQSDR